jgi:uncharacterized protein (TIGR02145 family)
VAAAATVTVVAYPAAAASQKKVICPGTSARLDAIATPATAWQWYEGSTPVPESSGTTANYITGALTATATYSAIVANGACSVTSGAVVVSMSAATMCCGSIFTKPDTTVNFTAFSPCSATPNGAMWYLTDNRAGGNNQTYKVRKMEDGRIWMIQELRFGNCSSSTVLADTTVAAASALPTLADGYVGHCYNNIEGNVRLGYLYSFPAAVNSANAASGDWIVCTSTDKTCLDARQGVCPPGWMIPRLYNDWGYLNVALYGSFDIGADYTSRSNVGDPYYGGGLSYVTYTPGRYSAYLAWTSDAYAPSENNPNLKRYSTFLRNGVGWTQYHPIVPHSMVYVRCIKQP